jgi:hypothetical protein
MPCYCYECPKHGTFELTLPLRKWDSTKPCPKCSQPSEQVLLPQRAYAEFRDPIVVHVSADGKYRFPGAANARVPKGFERKELRTIREVESFERDVNKQLRGEAERHRENESRHFEEIYAQKRSELRQAMQQMSPLGRDFAQFAIKMNNARRRKPTDCGFHVEILHFDQGNREPQRDRSTDWRNRRS